MTSTRIDPRTTRTATPETAGDPAPVDTPRSTGDKAVGAVSHTVLVVWSALVIVPLLWVVMSSFKTSSEIFASPFALPERLRFDNYANAWTTAGIGSFFLNSVIVVFGALVVTMLFGSMSAYVLARFPFPGNRFIYYLMLAGLTFPIFLAVVPLFFVLVRLGLRDVWRAARDRFGRKGAEA